MTEHPTSPQAAVVVPAAGRGKRLGGTPKQFRRLGDRPVLYQTLGVFEAHSEVQHLIVAVSEDRMAEVDEAAATYGLTKLAAVVEGGDTRQASVARALEALPSSADVVLIHDAVRPLVTTSTISAVIRAVLAHGAAAPAIPVVDTLRAAYQGWFEGTIPRGSVFRMQTPQGFRRNWIEAAHREAAAGPPATDDVELVQRLGHHVRRVAGNAYNIKITTQEDWALAQMLWSEASSVDR